MTIGAYLQVYKNNNKVDFVLSKFREIYPDAPIYLVSDAGDDFTELSKKYNCFYEHATLNTGVSHIGFNKEQTLTWLLRFYNACKYVNTDHIIYLEDDVLVRRPIQINPEWNIAGVLINEIPACIVEYLRTKHNAVFNTTLYGACGGTIYKCSELIKIYDNMVSFINSDFDVFYRDLGVHFGFLDMFMPIFFMMNGYRYEQNTELIESHRNSSWRHSHHSIVHGKEIYG
jgi:hypothetical protein